ncbi:MULTISPECIES: nucleotidyltransferase domain-containing protein [Enterobacterales]|uniref:nucleotidyltransferase domain-containing protein n=1 Tax=Enterobacterales TaxID=91347 RepID=UPI0029599851|nr:nucleotidyltransferase [Enterobacter hormaechei]ELT0447258.1 nucleotidyltransferase [Enterobacter hormaechei subsp. xiangfangensis]ELX8366533.1 nucleotidyltransferase [Enterobacter hormaechei]MDY7150650.1 nucleotidyltransferase [Enterobacter hormaechei]
MRNSVPALQISKEKKQYVGDFLDCIVDSLDLTETQHNHIERAYHSVGKYISEGDNPILEGAVIYSQGSVRLNTTVKPKGSEQYDVDLLCYLPNASKATGWAQVLDAVYQRLNSHETYRKMLTPLPRGYRIMYAGDYHLDITPGIDWSRNASEENHPLWIPDSRLMNWKESNPAGYATWFDSITEKYPIFLMFEAACESLSKSASVRPLPNRNHKKLLNRIVQIFKRHRDVWAASRGAECVELKPISAIITTLSAHAYNLICDRERIYSTDFDVILDVLDLMKDFIVERDGYIYVSNPSMHAENFAEKWNIAEGEKGYKLHRNFLQWREAAIENINEIAASVGEDELLERLSKYFGERPVKAVRDAMLEEVNSARIQNGLNVLPFTGALSAGTMGASASAQPIPTNTFYGGEVASPIVVPKNTFFGD